MKRIGFLLFVLIQTLSWSAEPIHEVSAYWNGEGFYEVRNPNSWKKKGRFIEGTSIYFSAGHITCYGHALLDGVFPLYCMLKEYDLINQPITLLIAADMHAQRNKTFLNVVQLLKDVFCFKEIVILKKGDFLAWFKKNLKWVTLSEQNRSV